MASSAANVAPIESNGSKRRMCDGGRQKSYRFKKQKTSKPTKDGSNEEVLIEDVRVLLQKQSLEDTPAKDYTNGETEGSSTATGALPEPFSEIDLTVSELSSTGDGLAIAPDTSRVYVVPFTAPGDTVTAKVIKHFHDHPYTLTDFVKVQQPSPHRDDTLVQCPYFAKCSGCQFQMLPYSYQLEHKKTIVEKAYKNFSNLPPELIPPVEDTIGSPLQYGYRTKLTPHFDGPPGKRSDKRKGIHQAFTEVPPIGFMQKGTRRTIDIEDCPIGTDAVRMGMKWERKRVAAELSTYKRGATLLLRESTKRVPKPLQDATTNSAADESVAAKDDVILEDRGDYVDEKTCVTNSNATTTEYIDNFVFENPAGSFFQNNNSILPTFTQYIRERILPPASTATTHPKITNLIDAYSGSGLFTITLSSLFVRSLGIDISGPSIASATTNAALNNLPRDRTTFLAADAANLFASIDFPGAETVVVIDPPRKGCDESFLRQLIRFSPARVVYVSCNVHTQARDVGVLVGGMEGVDGGTGPGRGVYEIESLRGFDFFPQTGHVEGVAVLRKKAEAGGE
ncbi:23S rRNA (uracil-5-)-methyltransferase RumA [Coniosporium apollinis CBS 100218]|uniref:tRNA (uracil(54)-C(5))-methyltransferase n=1 Tax=Coniosporium apollinis (strain CBS 100218) TaxID=1168221 RepID=R7YHD2_CONA1|nr:23S rRNA (uracil-5-)-methyltransferase RumA [Coniosporium apollinis CBS 100218]EON61303.1 23S rRNA (uracil-5-)-methyltransferase RumA [Coniosporium apollinis CBS 100218]